MPKFQFRAEMVAAVVTAIGVCIILGAGFVAIHFVVKFW